MLAEEPPGMRQAQLLTPGSLDKEPGQSLEIRHIVGESSANIEPQDDRREGTGFLTSLGKRALSQMLKQCPLCSGWIPILQAHDANASLAVLVSDFHEPAAMHLTHGHLRNNRHPHSRGNHRKNRCK